MQGRGWYGYIAWSFVLFLYPDLWWWFLILFLDPVPWSSVSRELVFSEACRVRLHSRLAMIPCPVPLSWFLILILDAGEQSIIVCKAWRGGDEYGNIVGLPWSCVLILDAGEQSFSILGWEACNCRWDDTTCRLTLHVGRQLERLGSHPMRIFCSIHGFLFSTLMINPEPWSWSKPSEHRGGFGKEFCRFAVFLSVFAINC